MRTYWTISEYFRNWKGLCQAIPLAYREVIKRKDASAFLKAIALGFVTMGAIAGIVVATFGFGPKED